MVTERQQGQSKVGEKEADDLFDVAVDNELSGGKKGGGYAAAGKKRAFGDKGAGPNPKRQKKDSKYGFGGKKKYSKSGDAISSGDISGFSVKKNRSSFGGSHGGAKGPGRPAKKTKTTPRLGKSKRQAAAGKR
jgi:rRNA-processing protein EBP2